MLKKIIVVAAIFGFLFSSSFSFAEEKQGVLKKLIDFKNKAFTKKDAAPAVKAEAKPVKPAAPAAKIPLPPKKAFTKDEIAKHVKEMLDHEEEVINLIPGLKKSMTEKGESFYTYEGTRLEDLDKGTLDKIFSRMNQEVTRIRTERLNKQLESIRHAQQITSAAAGAAKIPTPPPQPPRIYSGPSVPSTPPSVAQPPRTPVLPPAPPRR